MQITSELQCNQKSFLKVSKIQESWLMMTLFNKNMKKIGYFKSKMSDAHKLIDG